MVEWLEKLGYCLDSDNKEIVELPEMVKCVHSNWEEGKRVECSNLTRYGVQGTSEYDKKYNMAKPLCQHHIIEDGLNFFYVMKIRYPPKVYPNRVWIAIQYIEFERLFRESGLSGNGVLIHKFWKALNDMAVEKAWATM